MTYLLVILSVVMLLCGILVLFGQESLLRLPRVEGPATGHLSKMERVVAGSVLVFVGVLLATTTYSSFVIGNPYWFMERVFGLFT